MKWGGHKPPLRLELSFLVNLCQIKKIIEEDNTMTKAELIETVAADAGISKKEAGEALASLINGITAALKKKDGKIAISGFGSFTKARRKSRKGVNPRTGEKITIKAHNVIKFQAAKALKEAV
jgi:DNA-binding protein HU-beta